MNDWQVCIKNTMLIQMLWDALKIKWNRSLFSCSNFLMKKKKSHPKPNHIRKAYSLSEYEMKDFISNAIWLVSLLLKLISFGQSIFIQKIKHKYQLISVSSLVFYKRECRMHLGIPLLSYLLLTFWFLPEQHCFNKVVNVIYIFFLLFSSICRARTKCQVY